MPGPDPNSDPVAAPEGKDAIVVLVPVGHLLQNSESDPNGENTIRTFQKGATVPDKESQDWPALVERARRQVIECMETRLGITGLREKIVWEEVNTPITCELRLTARSSEFVWPTTSIPYSETRYIPRSSIGIPLVSVCAGHTTVRALLIC